jgi:predicted dienelactone hydrolase
MLSMACGGQGGTAENPAEPTTLLQPGPYRSGFAQRTVTYTSPLNGRQRAIPVRVWYPADEDAVGHPADYIVGDVAEWLGHLELPDGLGNALGRLGNALDAPPVASGGPFPVAVYSHSSESDGLWAYPYAEHLAEHGWIVLAPNHVGDTSQDLLTGTEIERARALAVRPADVSASLDWLENAAGTVGLEGAVDTSDALIVGHSRGGATALLIAGARLDVDALVSACRAEEENERECEAYEDPAIAAELESSHLDPRFTAIVAQAPAAVPQFAQGELAGIEAPVMLMTGDLDMTTPDAGMAWELLDGADDVWIRVPDGAHLSFLTICEDLGPILDFVEPSAMTDGCGPDFVPADEAVEVLRAYVLAYGLRYSLGEQEWDGALRPPALDEIVEIIAR